MNDDDVPQTLNRNKDHAIGRRAFYWWADRPSVQIVVFVLMTTLAIIGYLRPSLVRELFTPPPAPTIVETTTPSALPAPPMQSDEPPDVTPFRVAGGECIVVATCDDFFTNENLAGIRSVVADLEAAPQVKQVLWIDSIPGLNLFGLPEAILPASNASPRQLEIGRTRVAENPFAVGQLISEDGRTILLHVRLDWFFVTTDEACTSDLREIAAAAAARTPGADINFQVTGFVPLELMMTNNHLRNAWRYQIIGYSIMMIAAVILFRGFSAVSIVAIAPAVGVFWTLGMLHFFNLQDNPFNDIIVPVLISLVGLTDAVHMMVEIRSQRSAGKDTREATRQGVARVGLACALTSLTTAIGFASLAWAHHPIVRQFGWCCVLGVGLTFVSVVTVVPLGCRSPLGRRLHVGLGKSLIDAQLKRIGPIVAGILQHDRKFAWLAIATTIVLAVLCTQLTPDEKRFSGLSESGEAARALRHLDQSLGGLEFGHVHINWSPEADDEEVLRVINKVDAVLESEPLIRHQLGLTQLLDALPGDSEGSERMALLELLPAEIKRAFYTPEHRSATIQFRVQDIGIAKYAPVFERVEAEFAAISEQHTHFGLGLSGNAIDRWKNIFQIVSDLVASLGTASVVIWLILTVAYRSIRIGLISIIPNIFPLVATGAMLYFTGQYLEIVSVCVFTICVGIAVDDTIHFLTRYAEEDAACDDHEEAIKRAFGGVGSALLMTTIVLVTGMLTAVFGDARDARLFGIMGSITLTSALFADIVFLPALLSRFAKGRRAD